MGGKKSLLKRFGGKFNLNMTGNANRSGACLKDKLEEIRKRKNVALLIKSVCYRAKGKSKT